MGGLDNLLSRWQSHKRAKAASLRYPLVASRSGQRSCPGHPCVPYQNYNSDLCFDAVDIGCGAGLTLVRLAELGRFHTITGVEPSVEAITHAKSLGDFDVRQGTAEQLPCDTNSADMLTCFDVLQHLDAGNDKTAVAEMARVLRPGGVVVLRTSREMYSPHSLAKLMKDAGFDVLQSSYVNCVGSLLQELRGRISPRQFRANPTGGGLPGLRSRGVASRLMEIVGTIEAFILTRVRIGLPFGHSVMLVARNGAKLGTTGLPTGGDFG